jgi:sec-independent protein translocase protein TatB
MRFDELIIVAVIAVVVLGPQRLPEYAAKLARLIKQLRVMAEGAQGQLKEQLGPEFQDVDWRQYDPRRYDPRRIVREALVEPLEDAVEPFRQTLDEVTGRGGDATEPAGPPSAPSPGYDAGRPTAYDTEAT